jgi:putative ABC transport system ATP-binding protein
LIRLEGVEQVFPSARGESVPALRGIDLHVRRGELLMLQGPNGGGKTTLLQVAAGLLRPTRGVAYLADQPISRLPESLAARLRRTRLGLVFQRLHLPADLRAWECAAMPLLPEGLGWAALRSRARAALERLDLLPLEEARVLELSMGQRQSLALARALVADPEVLLLDEPSASLDPERVQSLVRMLSDLKAAGKTLLIASHDPALTELGDRALELRRGSLGPC